jgi:hypothetical protein
MLQGRKIRALGNAGRNNGFDSYSLGLNNETQNKSDR